MKKHLFGVLLLLLTFALGLVLSPISFSQTSNLCRAVTHDGDSKWVHGYRSTYLIRLFHEGEKYESKSRAKQVYKKRLIKAESEEIKYQEVLEQIDMRTVIHFERKDKLQGYCIFRVENDELRNICSTSLWHVLEFEKQNY